MNSFINIGTRRSNSLALLPVGLCERDPAGIVQIYNTYNFNWILVCFNENSLFCFYRNNFEANISCQAHRIAKIFILSTECSSFYRTFIVRSIKVLQSFKMSGGEIRKYQRQNRKPIRVKTCTLLQRVSSNYAVRINKLFLFMSSTSMNLTSCGIFSTKPVYFFTWLLDLKDRP